jgi:hypothetical protein
VERNGTQTDRYRTKREGVAVFIVKLDERKISLRRSEVGIDLGRGPCKVAGIELVEPCTVRGQSVRRDEEARSLEVTYNRYGVLV